MLSVLIKSFPAIWTASALLNSSYDQKATGWLQFTYTVVVDATKNYVHKSKKKPPKNHDSNFVDE